ncbi:DEAD/DEAH box helicase, putative [Eimeria praecox]|uniref:ATP-dependent RNA helicase n=1 Tax=Eimeria praecox TaxID=51316 RepID=U6G1C9_9EIME|nr:DEAD/DEAH box helicase, putative [Eimeria praecox]
MEDHQPQSPEAASSATQQSLPPDTAPPTAEEVSALPSPDTSAGGDDKLHSVEIDATLDGISREGLLHLLQELQQQSPELLRILPSQHTSSLDTLPTEQLRGLVEQLLNLAEAADVQGSVEPVGASPKESPTAPAQDETKPQHTQPKAKPQKKREDTKTKHNQERLQPRKQEQNDRQQQNTLLPPETDQQEQPLPVQQKEQQDEQGSSEADSLGKLLESTNKERQALAAEAAGIRKAGIRKFVETKAGPLSLEAKKDLLLTLLAVTECEAYCPKEPEVRQLFGLDRAGMQASAAGCGGAGNVAEQAESVDFGGLPVVLAWRRLLQLPENALLGENTLSAREAEALSAEEVKMRYLRVVKQAKGESIKASIQRFNCMDHPERPMEGPVGQPISGQSLEDVSAPQRTLDSKPQAKVGSAKPQEPEDSKHSLEKASGKDSLDRTVDAVVSTPATATDLEPAEPEDSKHSLEEASGKDSLDQTVDAVVSTPATATDLEPAVQDSLKPSGSASENPMAGERDEDAIVDAASTSAVVPTPTLGVSKGKNDDAIQNGRESGPEIQEKGPLDLSQKPKAPLRDDSGAEDSGNTSGSREPTKLRGGAARFAALGLNDVVSSAAVAFLGGAASRPTPAQRLVVPQILEAFTRTDRKSRMQMAGKSSVDRLVALRAHTGSGKTLAFLLPLMQALREQETAAAAAEKRAALWEQETAAAAAEKRAVGDERKYIDLLDCNALAETLGGHSGRHRALLGRRGPRALVICPSRPLASQVASAAAALAKRIRLSVGCTTGGVGTGAQLRLLQRRPVDILIGTPDRLLCLTRPSPTEGRSSESKDWRDSILKTTRSLPSLENVQFCILDEADASWRGGFREDVEKLLMRSHFLQAASQQIREQLRICARPKVLLTCTATPNSGIDADLCELLELPADRVLTVSGGPSFPPQTQLRHEMMQAGTDRFLLLVEQIKTHPALRARKILGYDGSLPASVREKNLRSFQEGFGQRILVATDAVARGLHIGGVDAVINADFPLTAVEYLHRAGRTGRLDSKGFVLSFVSKKDAAVAAAVRASLSAGLSIEETEGRVPDSRSQAAYKYVTVLLLHEQPRPDPAEGMACCTDGKGQAAQTDAASKGAPYAKPARC